ncbi:MAG: cyclic nucleotide-binding protein [Polyangiaceae bacterium]|nr:cyclic nucleotide-binding protein [Polyangiaceae bacterium]
MNAKPATPAPSFGPAVAVDLSDLVQHPSRVKLTIGGGQIEVDSGTPLGDVLPETHEGARVVAALLGRRPVSLTTRVTWDAELEPMTLGTIEGDRIYRMSQALLLMEAAHRVVPRAEIRLAHSVGFGRRVLPAADWRSRPEELAELLQTQMRELVEADLPLTERLVEVSEALAYFAGVGWQDTVDLLATWRNRAVPLGSYGQVHALIMGPLLPSTGAISGYRVIADRGGLLLLYGRDIAMQPPPLDLAATATVRAPEAPAASAENLDSDGPDAEQVSPSVRPVTNEQALAVSLQTMAMAFQQDRWLRTMGIKSVGAFNQSCITGHVGELIHVSEGFHEKRISRIADEIHGRGKSARIVCIAGPSSSGKTTFIKRLSVQLRVLGVTPVPISLDDYYCDRWLTPRNARGEWDYEVIDALRLNLLQDQVGRLLAGEEVQTAHYDFKTGTSQPTGGRTLKLDTRSVLMLEGIHALNPKLLQSIGQDQAFRVFVCPHAQLPFDRINWLHASDVRLIRRIVRDRRTRGWSPAENIIRWEDVRAGERRNIFPFQHHADAVFDSSLIYEPAVLKVYAERYLLEVPRQHCAWPTAVRLLNLVSHFVTLYPDTVPPTSILREFIGESGFEY